MTGRCDSRPISGRVRLVSTPKASTFDEAAEWYDYAAADHFWFQWRLAALRNLIEDLRMPLSQPLRVLDVGCGTGTLRGQLERATNWIVDGTDLNLGALRRAPEGRGQICYYDVCDRHTAFLRAYDAVLLCDVIEHIDDTRPFLAAVIEHLRPGGHLLVSVPALPVLYSPYDEAAGHVRRYNKTTLAASFAGLDVDLVQVRYWGLTLLPVLALRSLLLRVKRPGGSILRHGFVPPRRSIDRLLRLAMRTETTVCRRPILGTSLLAAARKL